MKIQKIPQLLQLTFNAGKTIPDSGKHYYVVYYIKVDDEGKAPRACWAEHKGDPSGKKKSYFIDFFFHFHTVENSNLNFSFFLEFSSNFNSFQLLLSFNGQLAKF